MGTTYGDAVLKEFDDPLLKEHVDSISLSEAEPASSDRRFVDLTKAALNVHVYQLNECGPITEELDEEEEVTASQHWVLPCCQLPQRDVLRR
jgi:hypothetical protein